MKKLFVLVIIAIFSVNFYAQKLKEISDFYTDFERILTVKIGELISPNTDGGYGLKMKSPISITSYAIGWQTQAHNYQAGNFDIKYRTHNAENGWTEWQTDDCLINPDQNPLNIYKSDLLFGWDEFLHDSIEFYLYPPANEIITELYLFCIDINGYLNKPHSSKPTTFNDSKTCPDFPPIIMRTTWCGSNNTCANPSYTVTYRPNMTHSVIHHGASPSSYTDGAAIVYSYWTYHVNSNGWSDIGYNYLFDKIGNFYQGRKNPQLPTTDVHGAHAGYANTYSIGCNFLGDSDAPGTAPTTLQNAKLTDFLAWWFNHKSISPTSSASILKQDNSAWITLPRICGHRDVNPGGTTCPGNALYNLLPSFRTQTDDKITACQDADIPITTISTEKQWQNDDFITTFNDYDASGIKYAFYNVEYQDSNIWKTNHNKSFFKEDFNPTTNIWTPLLNTSWTNLWNISNGEISINNTSNNNYKIYVPITQNYGNTFLYNFKLKFNQVSSNPRAAIHFLCDDVSSEANFENTGHSYAIFFYQTGAGSVQIYRWTPYTYTSPVNTQFNANIWYDIKIILNTQTNEIQVFKDNAFIMSWIDPEPVGVNGNAFVLKAKEADVSFKDFNFYKTRNNEQLITVGLNNDIFYESINDTTPAGKINTIVIDNSDKWSSLVQQNIFLDTTTPVNVNITAADQWQTQNFEANLGNQDVLSGVCSEFYLVADFDGSDWSANNLAGFIYDDFTTQNPEWNSVVGTWTTANGQLYQNDLGGTSTPANNTNYSIAFPQGDEEYLYVFDMKIEGNTTNRRAGFHYFSDSETLANRGNGYFIFFRLNNQLEFYKVTNDVFSNPIYRTISLQEGQWINVKLIFNRSTGRSVVYLDDKYCGEWIDEDPYQTGNYVSFRTGNSQSSFKNFRIFRKSNGNPEVVLNSMIEDNHVRFQNPNSATPAAKVVTIAFDNADNISPEFSETFNIDWTKPDTISALTVIPDISSNLISATWNAATDQHSDVVSYWYSVGNVAGQDNLIAWTDNSLNLSVTDIYFNFLPNSITYFNVKSQNGAGLFSDIKSSEGIINGEPPTCNADFSADQTTIKVCDTVIFTDISTVSGTTITTREWSFQAGDPLTSNAEYQNVIYSQSGTYDVTLSITTSSGCTDTETKSGFIVVEDDISFNDIMVEDIKIYPNPNNGKFVIDFSAIKYENQRVNYKLIDDLGRIVFEKNEQLNSPKININEQLSNGIYYLILNIDGKNVEKKIAVY